MNLHRWKQVEMLQLQLQRSIEQNKRGQDMKRWNRLTRLCLAVVAPIALIGGAAGAATAVPGTAGAATAAAPACTFNGSSFPILLGAKAGEKVAISCTGLGILHPYLVMETSLLLAVDPAAKPLLTGQIVSLPGLLSLVDSLPEVNTAALRFPLSGLSGGLTMTYTLPASHAPDPNAVCPPTAAQINAGLIGCGLTMINLTSFTPVAAGSILVQYAGDPLFPPNPTMVGSTVTATPGSKVSVADAPGATTFWWAATLASLAGLLGGGAPPKPIVNVLVKHLGTTRTAANNITVSPAVYNRPVLTPPVLSGGFTVPAGLSGAQKVTVNYIVPVLGFVLRDTATISLTVN
jgi:hypothetical protein